MARELRIAASAVGVLLAQRVEHERARAVDLDAERRDERVERLDDPGVDRQRAAARVGAGQLAERRAGVGVPQHVEADALAVERARRGQPRGRGRVDAAEQRLDAAPRAGVDADRLLVDERLGARERQRREQRAVGGARDRSRQQRLGRVAGARGERPPAAPVVARRADDADPALVDRRQPGDDLRARAAGRGSARGRRRRARRPSRRRAPTTRARPSRSAAPGCRARG